MKDHIRRIQFYTRKAAEWSQDRRPRCMKNPYRYDRLIRYKQELNRRIEADRYRWKPAIDLANQEE